MSNDRVEELEATVSELESTVRGLTEELVETKERVRLLEDELEAELGRQIDLPSRPRQDGPGDRTPSAEAGPEDVQEAAAEADKGEGSQQADEPEDSDEQDDSELGDDIIVA